ncbi:MAG TPA: aconitate hydratase, partial [Candidatus Sumerlaeota bacterium]|nr:aconitate hydratase [Candidatus Sumerlaeota bacterium]
ARIHRKNLINCGIAPLLCNTDAINQDDKIVIDLSGLSRNNIIAKNLTKSAAIPIRTDMTPLEIEILFSGGILAYTKSKT